VTPNSKKGRRHGSQGVALRNYKFGSKVLEYSKCNLQDFDSYLYLVKLRRARKEESNCHWGRIQMQSMQLCTALAQ
jgi:hypothetical protein